ncbi:MAG: radical SAM protein [Candidatus Bathyarchaeia archaeon]|jgi:spore photoproduct lyase
MENLEERKKHKEAALKAWKTIRSEKRNKASRSTSKLTNFISPEKIEKIKHPERVISKEEKEHAWQGNRIVVPFDKTPPDIACGMFWELRWAYGCPFNCSYCYLRGTMRGKMKPQYVRTELVLQALDEAFAKIETPAIFNSGELSDSLMNSQLMKPIVDKFEEQKKHKIYLLSKCGTQNIGFLQEKLRKQVICGWSINAPEIAIRWEKGAAPPENRIEAAAMVSKAGYDTRIRIDPIFPVKEWQVYYTNLLERILSQFTPKRIILGTPRGLWKTIKYAKEANANLEWTQFFAEDTSWGKKLAFEQRKEIYQFFFDKLRSVGYHQSKISLCKETAKMLEALKLKYSLGLCNCYNARVFN